MNMVSPIHKKLNQTLAPFLDELDPEGKEILEDLLRQMYPYERTIIPTDGAFGFWGQKGGVVVMAHEHTLEKFLAEEVEEMRKDQFVTAAENRRYCKGTTGLLSLLTRFHYHQTDKCVIMAIPDAKVRRKGRASLTANDLLEYYGEEREVVVIVVMDRGFLTFKFEQTVRPGEPA
jgi:hypothetical protein